MKVKAFILFSFITLPQDDTSKKMALVYEPGYDEPSEVYDTPDDEVGTDGLRDAVEMNLLMKAILGINSGQKSSKEDF